MEDTGVGLGARYSKNLFGLSNRFYGVLFVVLGSLFNAVDAMILTVAENQGVSSNTETMISAFTASAGAVVMDIIFYFVGYNDGKVHWFVLFDIWRPRQRQSFVNLPYFVPWFVIFGVTNYFNTLFNLISYVFADNVADAIAIYDLYPIIVPLFGLCLHKYYPGFDWKHRYFLCFAIGIVGLLFLAQPGFVFGYSSDVDLGSQMIACLTSIVAAVFAAIYVVSNTIIETITDRHSKKIASESVSDIQLSNEPKSTQPTQVTAQDDQLLINEDTPLVGAGASNAKNPDAVAASGLLERLDELSSQLIICNEWALVTVTIEYASLITMAVTLVFTLLSLPQGSWFWDEFVLGFDGVNDKGVAYTWLGGLVWIFDYYFYTYGIFKLRDATLSGLLDTTDVFFSFILSYWCLGEDANTYDIVGSLLIVLTVALAVYPWENHSSIPKWW